MTASFIIVYVAYTSTTTKTRARRGIAQRVNRRLSAAHLSRKILFPLSRRRLVAFILARVRSDDILLYI